MNLPEVPASMILMADDDEEDRLLAKEALQEAGVTSALHCVSDGEQLLQYLRRQGEYARYQEEPFPCLILLDLNMPRLDGREALAIIKRDSKLRHIPIVVLTTSQAETDVMKTYELGANSFITKPVTFAGLVDLMANLRRYWFELVQLPKDGTIS